MSFDIVEHSDTNTQKLIILQKTLNISRNMQTNSEFAWNALTTGQEIQSKQANKHWTDISYTIGDKIGLSIKNITIDWLSKKLDYRILEYFEDIRNARISVKLQLLQSMNIHNVFYPNLFCKASIDLLSYQVNKPPSPVIINRKEKLKVEEILDARSQQGKLDY